MIYVGDFKVGNILPITLGQMEPDLASAWTLHENSPKIDVLGSGTMSFPSEVT